MIENVDYKVINGESVRSIAKRQHILLAFLYLKNEIACQFRTNTDEIKMEIFVCAQRHG
jgi:hypothetical protein